MMKRKLNKKELEIARALVFYIRKGYPMEKLNVISENLGMKDSNLSRLLNLQALPSLQKIIEIEDHLKTVIIKTVPIDGQDFSQESSTRVEAIGSHYHQIINDKYYAEIFDRLLEKLETAFKVKAKAANLYFKPRKKERYVSINLIPIGLESGGYHLVMFRHSQSNHLLNIEFVSEKYSQFRDFLFQYVEPATNANETGTSTEELKLKKSGKSFALYERKDKKPSIVYTRPLIDEDIELIVNLAMWVYLNKK